MAEEISPEEAGQSAEPPKAKKKKDGKMSMPTIIGIVAGVVVLQVVIIIVIVQVFFSNPEPVVGEDGQVVEQAEDKPREYTEDELDEMEFKSEDSRTKRISTGRITTNPKDNIASLVVMDFTLVFLPHEEVPDELLVEGGPLMTEIYDEIKHTINMTLGSMTKAEIQENRNDIPVILKEELKPIFRRNNLFLRRILQTEFLMQ